MIWTKMKKWKWEKWWHCRNANSDGHATNNENEEMITICVNCGHDEHDKNDDTWHKWRCSCDWRQIWNKNAEEDEYAEREKDDKSKK